MAKKKNKSFLSKYFFYLVLLSFVFVSTTALSLSKDELQLNLLPVISEREYTKRPVLKAEEATFPVTSAQSVLAVDLDSGVILFEKDPEKPLLPASTTKIVTALVALDYYPMDRVITVNTVGVEGQKMGLVPGEEIRVRDLLKGLLIYSANDAAEVLAANYPGGRENFIAAMNIKAKRLNLEKTHFSNPSGLESVGHVSTAEDLVRIATHAMTNEFFSGAVATESEIVESADGRVRHYLTNINRLVGTVDGVLGVKTGWTQNARENLVTYVERGDKRVMIALLGSQDRFGETEEVINWIFDNYTWKDVRFTASEVIYSP